jgi:hypothetical protein
VGLEYNQLVDERTRHAEWCFFDRPFPPVDFHGLARSALLREWQGKWDTADTGRLAHSILPRVGFTLSRIISDHWPLGHA